MGTRSFKFLGIFLLFQIVWSRYAPIKFNHNMVLTSTVSVESENISGLSLDPNDFDNQKHLLGDMDPQAVKELLITKQPVIQYSTDDMGKTVKITYEITPSGDIRRERTTEHSRNDPNKFHLLSNLPSPQTSVFRSRGSFDDFDNLDITTTTEKTTTTPKPDVKPITIIDLDELPGTSLIKEADYVTHRTYIPRPKFPTDNSISRNPFKINWEGFPQSGFNRDTDTINRRTYSSISTSNGNSDVPYEIIPTRNFGYNFGSYPVPPLSEIPESHSRRTFISSPRFNVDMSVPRINTNLLTEETKKYMVLRHNDGIKLEANCTLNKFHSTPQSHTSFRDSLTSNNGFSLPHSSEWNPNMIDQTFTKTIRETDGSRSTETCTINNVELPRKFINHSFVENTTQMSAIPTCINPESKDSEPDDSIDGFLKRIQISEEDIRADGGEYIKNIIEKNGRILSIKLILSNVQGDSTKSANLNDPLNEKPIK